MDKQAVHLRVGQLRLQNTPPEELELKRFDIVNQLNQGRALIQEQTERDELGWLNLQAGKKAKASAAYQPAFSYLQIGIGLMNLGFPIGLEADIADFIAGTEVRLNPGEVAVLYTDGITEAENIGGELYGLDRLIESVQENCQLPAVGIKEGVIEDVRRYIGEQKVFDDITLVVLK